MLSSSPNAYRLSGDMDDSGPLLPAVMSRQPSLLPRASLLRANPVYEEMDPAERRKALTAMGAEQVSFTLLLIHPLWAVHALLPPNTDEVQQL